jgi:hypothetical protein
MARDGSLPVLVGQSGGPLGFHEQITTTTFSVLFNC